MVKAHAEPSVEGERELEYALEEVEPVLEHGLANEAALESPRAAQELTNHEHAHAPWLSPRPATTPHRVKRGHALQATSE